MSILELLKRIDRLSKRIELAMKLLELTEEQLN